MLGRGVKTSRPGFTGQSASEETSVYDDYTGGNTSRLLKTTRTGFAPTLYVYDTMSRVVRSGLDLDGSDTLTLTSSDRITDVAEGFESFSSAWWFTKTVSIYPYTGGSASTAVQSSKTRKRLTGLGNTLRAETRTYDPYDNATTVTVESDAINRLVTTTTQPGLVNAQVDKHLNGLLVQTTSHDGLVHKTRYDALARVRAQIEPRTGTEGTPTTSVAYYPNTTWKKEVRDAAGKRLAFTHYDAAGRAIYGEDAYGKTTRTAFTARGEVEYVWGTATYPVSYAYNTYGERTTMRTYQNDLFFAADTAVWPGGSAVAQETTWEFDTPSGLLKKKTDAQGRFTEYTYNVRGQTATRLWSRTLPSSSTRVTSTYAYFGDGGGEPPSGELKSVSYNDGTPTVSYTYTRIGQQESVEDAAGTRDFVYDPTYPHRLATEALDTFYGSGSTRQLTFSYDTATSTSAGTAGSHTLGTVFGRLRGFKVGTSGTPAGDLEFVYELSNTGRFAAIDSRRGNGAASRKFLYGYETDSALLKTLAIDGGHAFTITRSFEANRDLLTTVEAKWSTTSRTKFVYAYDDLGRRQSVVQSGDVFADYGGADGGAIHQIFEYNDRSELKTAATYLGATATDQTTPLSGRRHEFGYDAIGNRKSSNTSGVAVLADQYAVNLLNQYTGRENNTLPVGGVADATAMVAAGAHATALAGRAGKHWGDNVLLPNGNAPYTGLLKIFAVKAGGGSGGADLVRSENKTAFIPPAWQTFSYDHDGNLLSDGIWNFTWDAENRLAVMETRSEAIGAIPSGDARRLEFKYDYLGRRVEKIVRGGWNGSSFATLLSQARFLYDGWNLVAEFGVTGGSTLTLARSYTWGLDIARSMTEAGGVGALLQIRDYTDAKDYLPSYDGNGNVVALFDAAAGSSATACVAAYEYSPYGEFLRSEGTYATKNPFRFSTKFTDDESGLVYYGLRYYSPSQGRFVGRDPSEESGGLNLYGFCRNNSLNLWDYLGMNSPDYSGWTYRVFSGSPDGTWGQFTDRVWKDEENEIFYTWVPEDFETSSNDESAGMSWEQTETSEAFSLDQYMAMLDVEFARMEAFNAAVDWSSAGSGGSGGGFVTFLSRVANALGITHVREGTVTIGDILNLGVMGNSDGAMHSSTFSPERLSAAEIAAWELVAEIDRRLAALQPTAWQAIQEGFAQHRSALNTAVTLSVRGGQLAGLAIGPGTAMMETAVGTTGALTGRALALRWLSSNPGTSAGQAVSPAARAFLSGTGSLQNVPLAEAERAAVYLQNVVAPAARTAADAAYQLARAAALRGQGPAPGPITTWRQNYPGGN